MRRPTRPTSRDHQARDPKGRGNGESAMPRDTRSRRAAPTANYLLGKKEGDTAHPYPSIQLHPETQHIPLDSTKSHLRPPPPQLSTNSARNATVLVSAVSFRDAHRCAYTLLTAFQRAKYPNRVRVAVVDQALDGEDRCLAIYCQLASKLRIDGGAEATRPGHCPYEEQITSDERDARVSRGPLVARHYLQRLVQDEEFCLGIDGHSVFTTDWDVHLINDWLATENEMGVVTTYVHHADERVIDKNGDNNPHTETPHICDVLQGGHGIPRNEGATNVRNATRPILMSKWGAGFSFSKCHADRRVPIDPFAEWIFDGEEFSRAADLWMSGYDFYSPSLHGHAIYHNYTGNPVTLTWSRESTKRKAREEEMGKNRVKLHIGQPFEGGVNTKDFDKYSPQERARSLQQFLNFTGVSYDDYGNWSHRCHQLHWVPYGHPEVVEAVLPGWSQEQVLVADGAKKEKERKIAVPECIYHGTCEQLGSLTGICSDGILNGVLVATNLVLILGFISYLAMRRRKDPAELQL